MQTRTKLASCKWGASEVKASMFSSTTFSFSPRIRQPVEPTCHKVARQWQDIHHGSEPHEEATLQMCMLAIYMDPQRDMFRETLLVHLETVLTYM